MDKNYAKKQKGITLIALVVTIVILLILSGISLNIVLGNNGIITKAQEAKIANNHSTVYEAMQLQYDNYYTESTIRENDADFITDLKKKSILDENMDVNVETLVGKKLSTGNGSNLKDVYVVEKDETGSSYRLKYYGKTSAVDRDLGIIGYEKEGADEPSDTDIFDFNPATGEISLKYAECGYFRSGKIVYEASDSGVTKLKKIVVPSEINGVKVTTIGRPTDDYLYIGLSSPYVEEIVLPETIKKINCGAFAGCINLKRINIPDSVTHIWGYAFWYCRNLESLNMPNSVNVLSNDTLTGCVSLKNIKLSKNIEIINEEFSGLTSLQRIDIDNDAINYITENGILYNKNKTKLICYPCDMQQENYVVPESVVEIANNIESKNIKSITLSKNVIEIISGGFENCINLEMINVDNNNQYYISEDGILYNKEKTELICYPNNKKEQSYVMPDSLTKIPSDFNNKYLKSITLSKDFEEMGSFENFESLQEINVNENNSNYSSENGVLFNKDKTTLLGYPRNKEGESYVIPTSVTEIGTPSGNLNNVITNKNLKNITITRNVSKIHCDFSYCANLQNIDVDSENQNFTSEEGVLFYKDKLALMAYPSGKTQTSYIIPDGVKALLGFKCINLKELIIPSSVSFIMDDAFSGCPDLKVVIKKGSSLTMEDLEKSGLSQSQVTFEN